MTPDTCSTCRWWLAHGGKTSTGYCRKNAPVSYVYPDGTPAPKWPRTGPVDFCGRWTQLEEEAA